MVRYFLGLFFYVLFFFQPGFCGTSVIERDYDLERIYEDEVVRWAYVSMLIIDKDAKKVLPEVALPEVEEVQRKQPFSLSIKMSYEPVQKPVEEKMPEPIKEEEERRPCVKEVVVYFDFNESELSKKQYQALVEEIRKLKNECGVNRILTAVVHGYACPIGSEKYNKKLSALRAQKVADVLKQEGVMVIEVSGLGETNDESNVFCLNRRAVVKVKGVK